MRRTVRATLLLASLLTLCGCVQSKLDIYLNPDGTGKVVYEVLRGAPEDEFADWFSERDKENLARQSARDILQESKGVAAWRDVSTGFTKEKQFRFKGTAYFRSLNLLALRLSQFTLTQTRGQVLGMRVTAAFAEGKQERDPLFDDVGDDEEEKENLRVEDLMKKYRADYLQRRVFLAATLNVLQSNLTLHLPAAGAADGFKKQDERTFTLACSGTKILDVLDQFMKDDVWLRKKAEGTLKEQNFDPAGEVPAFYARIFGGKDKPYVETAERGKPLFDFEKELAEAKADAPKVKEATDPLPVKLGAEVMQGDPTPERFKSLRPGGVLLYWEEKAIADTFKGNGSGYSLSMIGELARPAIGVLDGHLDTAVADDGESLILLRNPDKLSECKLSKDGHSVIFDLEMRTPHRGSRGLREVSGYLLVAETDGLREADLGVMDIRTGGSSKVLDAKVEETDPGWVRIELGMPHFAFKEIEFYDGARTLECEGSVAQYGIDRTPIRCKFKDFRPLRCGVKVKFYALKIRRYEFKVTDVTLTGQPIDMKAAAAPPAEKPAPEPEAKPPAAEAAKPAAEAAKQSEAAEPVAKGEGAGKVEGNGGEESAAVAPQPEVVKEAKPVPEAEKPKMLGDPKAVFVLRSGVRVKAYMYVDAGDRYSVKDETGRIRILLKTDVEEIRDK